MHLLRKGLPTAVVSLSLVSFSLAALSRSEGSAVFLNGVLIGKVSAWSGGFSPADRAASIAGKLAKQNNGPVTLKGRGRDRDVCVNGETIVTVGPADAIRARLSVASLATRWAGNLRSAFALPPLKVETSSVQIPLGSSTVLRVVGSAFNQVQVSADASIIGIQHMKSGLRLRANSIGKSRIMLSAGGVQESVDIEVKPFAANFPQSITAEVTGAPATSTTVQGAIEAAVKTRLAAMPGAIWNCGAIVGSSIGSEQSKQYAVRVWAQAPNSFPSTGVAYVSVKNAAVPPQTDTDLWYSNDPETVHQPGPLFSATLKEGKSARLLYHHQNGSTNDLFLRVEMVNESDKDAKVVLIPGDSKPDRDPVRAGMCAADQFVRNWIFGSGEVLTIPAHRAMPISVRRLSPMQTGSGLCSIRCVEGSELLVRTDALAPFPLDSKWSGALYSSTPWHEVGTHAINEFDRAPFETSQHIYPNPYKAEQVTYDVGGRYGFVRIGQRPIARQDADGSLDGNFGVIYSIRARVNNPTTDGTDVEVIFEASAGYSGGLFVVNGRYMKTPLLAPKSEAVLTRFHIGPGATQTLDITTLPLSGSSYPATITIRPVVDSSGAVRISRT